MDRELPLGRADGSRRVNTVALTNYMLYFNMKGQTLVEAFRYVAGDKMAQLTIGTCVPNYTSEQNHRRSIALSKLSRHVSTNATRLPSLARRASSTP